jgi:tetratricopeptide (TPR) repeat protein
VSDEKERSEDREDPIKSQMIEHEEEGILLERIKFDDEKENNVTRLSILDQSILLSLCLDVKNNNPADGLTAEQMGAYLARVLDHNDDWMIYSTALLERAWLECERTHGRERAILQIQALADQHTNRLTITQSTFESIEDSAPPHERLQNLHSIVYPPRWVILRDLAERYAKIGIVTSAAELFEEVELWDGVVECYRHAGKLLKAEQIVRKRLEEAETPRMWAALGDLTNDPSHYDKALELSNGRFSDANVALGKHYFDKGEMEQAAGYYQKALKIRPLMPNVWFRLGVISMQLGNWKTALNAFSEVVQQEPEEAEAWANVAAVHMHNRMPAQAYPALNEVSSPFAFKC